MFRNLGISLKMCSSCHISHLASTSMSKTLTYDPRVYIPSISVHLRVMIKRVFVPVGKGLKLYVNLQFTLAYIYIAVTSINTIVVCYMLLALLRPLFTIGTLPPYV